jgi:drug/metabolite transporter (DMT)-like permease
MVTLWDNVNSNYNPASPTGQSNRGFNLFMRLKADLLLFMVAIIWGTAFVAQGIAGQYHVAYLFNGVSFMLAALILIPFIPRGTKISKDQWKWMFVAGVVLFIATAMQQVGLLFTKVANASFLTSLYAVFTPFLLWISFREKPHWLDMIAVTMAGIGAFLLSTSGKFEAQPGDSIELIGSLFWALHFVVLGKFASKFDSVSFAAGHFFISGFINFVIGLFVEDISILAALPLLSAILYRATLSIGIGYTLQVWGQKHTPPTDAALILGLEAVFAVIAAWILLDQKLLLVQVIGCIIIFVGVLISQLKEWNSGTIEHDHLVEGR